MRRTQHELEVARSTITKLEASKRETEEKINNINKVYQGELEQLKKKEAANRNTKQNLGRIRWDIERDLKRIMQEYSKKFVTSKDSSQKLLGEVKSLEEEILGALAIKLGES